MREHSDDTHEPELMDSDEEKFLELEQYVAIDPDALDEEIVSFASHFYHIGLGYARAVSLRDAAKEDVSAYEAELDNQIRQTAVMSKEKLTEGTIEARITCDEQRLELVDKYMRQKHRADRWGVLRDAFEKKGFMLKELCELRKTEYYAPSAVRSEVSDAGSRVRRKAGIER